MMKTSTPLLTGFLSVCATLPSWAQPATVQVYTTTSNSIYAQQRIDMLPGFEATSGGFEAKIGQPGYVAGLWSTPLPWTPYVRPASEGGNGRAGLIGIHTHVLPDGKVLSWEGHNLNTFANPSLHTSHAYTWDSNKSSRTASGDAYPNVYDHSDNEDSNIFCSGHAFLPDGRLLVAGGHYSNGSVLRLGAYAVLYRDVPYDFPDDVKNTYYVGIRSVNVFNTTGSTWQTQRNSPVPAMTYRRWYPTNTSLSSGEILVVSGQQYPDANKNGVIADRPEVYNAVSNSWQELTGASRVLPLYPWMFLAPNGQVFNAGPNCDAKYLDPNFADGSGNRVGRWGAGTYNTVLRRNREYGSAVMYAPGKILILGGRDKASGLPNDGITNTAEIIDLNVAAPHFQQAAAMTQGRYHVNATILPDGSVLATGGTKYNSVNDAHAVLPAELWTPPTAAAPGGTWTTLNAMQTPRLYHSTAVLLPDATVLTAGGGQGGGNGGRFTDHPDYEIFTPPYLCQGLTRPEISSAPASVRYGQNFSISSPNAPGIERTGRVTLVRLSSVTHSFNMNQRFLTLRMTSSTSNQLNLVAPEEPNDCPPGHYMMFLVDGSGTPSHASIIAIDVAACASSLTIDQSVVSQSDCDRVTRLTVSGGGAGPYTWKINGVINTQNTGVSIDLATNEGDPAMQVRVVEVGGCNANYSLNSYFPRCNPDPICTTCPNRTILPKNNPTTR